MNINDKENNGFETKKHKTAKIVLRIIGFIILPIGLGLIIAGLISFFQGFSGNGMGSYFYLCFIGAPFIFVGGICLFLGYMRNIHSFTISQSAPVVKDVANYVIDGTSDTMIKNASKLFKEVKRNDEKPICSKCGAENEVGAKFCDKCGHELYKVCKECGELNDDDSSFCRKCGKEL